MEAPESEPAAATPHPPPYLATAALLLLGFVLQMFLWSHQWIYGDQYALLTPAVQYLETGELAPFSKMMSGGGRIPGTLLQWMIAAPLRRWADFRAPSLAMGLSQLVAVLMLMLVGGAAYGRRFAAFFVAVYWLSPWRLYHSGFLWEPGFVLLPAALHLGCCWLIRSPAAGEPDNPVASHGAVPGIGLPLAASFGLGASLVGMLQIHASFLLLVVATVILVWRRLIGLRPLGFGLGAATAGLTLAPALVAFANGELPRISPQIDQRVALPVLIVSNAGKAIMYWFRMGSADIGRRLRQTAWLADTPAGTEAALPLPSALVTAMAVLSVASVLIALYANWRYFSRDSAGRHDPDAAWLRSYTLVMLAAVAITGAVSPVPVQGWHLLIALHAACIPMAVWLSGAFDRGGYARALGVAFVALLVVTTILIGAGHPMYLRPDEPHVQQQDIPELLRHLIPAPTS
ncbi:MAG: hypothetical protein IH849_05740 [Acidobacteria bacterium]|nr:hypothetical protein [Acidobacteriota bacterium]